MKRRNNHFESCSVSSMPVFGMKFCTCRYLVLFLALFIVFATSASAREIPNLARPVVVVPEKIAGVTTVNAEHVIEILASDNPPLLLDARIRRDRKHGYIESSISLPDIETNCNALKKITDDKKQQLLFYCNGEQCGRSVVSIKIARSCGYHSLSWFRGGFAEWKKKGYPYIKSR